jgi:hypothetical protein
MGPPGIFQGLVRPGPDAPAAHLEGGGNQLRGFPANPARSHPDKLYMRIGIITYWGDIMAGPVKDMFLKIAEEWEKYWKDKVGLYDFLVDYVEINDDQRTYVIKKKKLGTRE